MQLCNRLGNGKAKPVPALLASFLNVAAEETVKNMKPVLFGNADARIRDGKPDTILLKLARDNDFSGIGGKHDGILEEYFNQPVQEKGVREASKHPVNLHADIRMTMGMESENSFRRALGRAFQRDRLRGNLQISLLKFRKELKVREEPCHPRCLIEDNAEEAVAFVGIIATHPGQQGLGKTHDVCNWCAELVECLAQVSETLIKCALEGIPFALQRLYSFKELLPGGMVVQHVAIISHRVPWYSRNRAPSG